MSIAVMHVPPVPPFPPELHGTVAVHLAIADPTGPDGAAALPPVPPRRRDGAVVSPPGDFIYHGVGSLMVAERSRIDAGLAFLKPVWAPADAGLAPGSWLEAAASAPSALSADVLERARSIADRVDPGRRIRRSRLQVAS